MLEKLSLDDYYGYEDDMKIKPKLIYFRDYSMFFNDKFREGLWSKLSMENITNTSNERSGKVFTDWHWCSR